MTHFKNTKKGRLVAQKYADILYLPQPEPPAKHLRMSLTNRAKIFNPFATLCGFDDEIFHEGARACFETIKVTKQEYKQ